MILSFNLRKQEQKWHSKGVLVLVLCKRKKYRLRNQEVVMTYQEYRYPLTCVRGVLHRPWSSVRFPQWQYKLIIHPRLFHIAFVSYSISPHLIVIVWRLVIRETYYNSFIRSNKSLSLRNDSFYSQTNSRILICWNYLRVISNFIQWISIFQRSSRQHFVSLEMPNFLQISTSWFLREMQFSFDYFSL